MKLFVESLMIFFGTLMTATLVALGEPANAELAIAQAATQPVEFVPAVSSPAEAPAAASGSSPR